MTFIFLIARVLYRLVLRFWADRPLPGRFERQRWSYCVFTLFLECHGFERSSGLSPLLFVVGVTRRAGWIWNLLNFLDKGGILCIWTCLSRALSRRSRLRLIGIPFAALFIRHQVLKMKYQDQHERHQIEWHSEHLIIDHICESVAIIPLGRVY